MIDSQPSASKPRNVRPRARRETQRRGDPVSRRDLAESALWKVQLQLAPSEIGLVYRQGLARGAEVCRYGSHDWRPLLTTPELHAALVARASWPDLDPSPSEVDRSRLNDSSALTATVTVSQTLAIRDPALAALLLAPARPSALPPPPPVVTLAPRVRPARALFDSIPDSAVTQPLPTRVPLPSPESEVPAASFTPPPPRARSAELSVVAALSVLATLVAVVLAQRMSHWGEARALIADARSPSAAESRLPQRVSSPRFAAAAAAPRPSIPVVHVLDLPVEARALRAPFMSSAAQVAIGGSNRNQLTRALSRAVAAARSCGSGPVHAQVVATFAPSGVPQAVHFGASAPPAVLRSCVLNAVARARVAPFVGAPVTVSKSLSW